MDFPFFDHQTFLPVYLWLEGTQISWAMRNIPWAWPLCESIHFIGLSLLLGTVGFFDLRLLGFARRVPMAAPARYVHQERPPRKAPQRARVEDLTRVGRQWHREDDESAIPEGH